MTEILTPAQFYRKIGKFTCEAYPRGGGAIPWYRLLVAQPVWPAQTTSDGASYQRVYVYGLRGVSLVTYRMLHDWYLAETEDTFLSTLARGGDALYPVPHASELRRHGIVDAEVRIDWRGWKLFFESRMVVALRTHELSDKMTEVLIDHLGGTPPDEQTVRTSHGICIGVETLMPPAWCSGTFNVTNQG